MTTENENKVVISETLTIENLLEGADLSEDSKAQIAAVFESAVGSQVEEIAEQLRVDHETRLEEGIAEGISSVKADLFEQVDKYLDAVVSGWLAENKLVLESEVKVSLAEQFFQNMKTMLEQTNLEVSQETLGALDESVQTNQTLEEAYNKLSDESAVDKARIFEFEKKEKLAALSEGMVATDAAKLYKLSESIGDVKDIAEFEARMGSIKSTFWAKPERAIEEQVQPVVETGVITEQVDELTPIERLASVLNAVD